jgi:Family of unknown function (DUF6194)
MPTIGTIITTLCDTFGGVVVKPSWGETALFFNPDGKLPNGVYFCTFKAHDGAHDQASQLDREGVFRIAIGVTPSVYAAHFGVKPSRPHKGGVVDTGHDFSQLNQFTPHPIYAWMNWVQILSPSNEQLDSVFVFIEDAYQQAQKKYAQRIRALNNKKTQSSAI